VLYFFFRLPSTIECEPALPVRLVASPLFLVAETEWRILLLVVFFPRFLVLASIEFFQPNWGFLFFPSVPSDVGWVAAVRKFLY